MFFELANQRSQLRLVIGQGTVQKTFALAIQGDRMMRSLAYVDTDEDLDAVMLFNVSHACSRGLPRWASEPQQLISASTLQATSETLRIQPLSAITSCLPGPVTTPPGSWTTGGRNHAGPSWPTPAYLGSGTR